MINYKKKYHKYKIKYLNSKKLIGGMEPNCLVVDQISNMTNTLNNNLFENTVRFMNRKDVKKLCETNTQFRRFCYKTINIELRNPLNNEENWGPQNNISVFIYDNIWKTIHKNINYTIKDVIQQGTHEAYTTVDRDIMFIDLAVSDNTTFIVTSYSTPLNDTNINDVINELLSPYPLGELNVNEQIGPIEDWNTSAITDMSYMFAGSAEKRTKSINSCWIGSTNNITRNFFYAKNFNVDISKWDVSNVTNMEGMFHKASSFNQPLNSWDVSNVTNMEGMFVGATAFNGDINEWDVSNVTNMKSMFQGSESFNQPLNDWNVSNVTDMSTMFLYAENFNGDISQWNVSNVTDMSTMFFYAENFNRDISDWIVSSVTDMAAMFQCATAFNQPLNSWNVSKVTDMSYMFYQAVSFNQPLDRWNVGNVTNMESMFEDATAFNKPLDRWNVSNVTNMESMFENATAFNQVDTLDKFEIT